ncbi:MAG: signal recognition particle protein [Prevotella sp.]|nr:signal recognition particle protein [Bacteroides sp.]MCM1366363.1 signal recognition particle protein [Prevotella sp.]MCM1436279.1 signal recognition particle protein [Prevotella sp.]
MFESLTERLERSFKVLKGEGKITEINVAATLKDVRKALLEADVNYKIAKDFTNNVKEKALGQNVLTAVKPKELMLNIVFNELTELMGEEEAPLNLISKPSIILMSGLQGSGKTTFSGKLAKRFKSKGRHPLLVACDVYRPAAIEQLQVLGAQIDVPVYSEEENKNPVEIAQNAVKYAKENHNDIVIVDTAGRLAVDEMMMDEIASLKETLHPDETLFVVDAMTGQDAVNTAKAFNDRLDFDGVVMTKLDGDTRGGAALSIRSVVKKPIKLVGVGEKLEDIQEFNPQGMASRIIGNGDIIGIAKKVQDLIDEKEAEDIKKKIEKNKFDFNDFLSQMKKIQSMGSIKNIASMIPGLGKAIKDVDIDDSAFVQIEAIIGSMTPYEREHPECLNASRRKRIAKGCGRTEVEVNRFIKQFETTRQMMRQVSKMKNPAMMMKQMKQARRGRR